MLDIKKIREETKKNGSEKVSKFIAEFEREIEDASSLGYVFVTMQISTALLLNRDFIDPLEKHFLDLGFFVDIPEMKGWSNHLEVMVRWVEI